MNVRLDAIVLEAATQSRAAIDPDVVSDYAEAMANGAIFPPIVLFHDGANYFIADGFHRFTASQRLALPEIDAEVRAGTPRDALLYAVGANSTHGLRRTNADKRRAVELLLADAEWRQWTDHEIGRRCAVDPKTVAAVRSLGKFPSDGARTYTTKHGTVATMDTAGIGGAKARRAVPEAPKFKSRAAIEQRTIRMREMAADGYSSSQIAAAVGLSEESCRATFRRLQIDVAADRVMRGTRRPSSNAVMENISEGVEHFATDLGFIDVQELDGAQLGAWIDRLDVSLKSLGKFKRELMQERQRRASGTDERRARKGGA